MTMMRTKAAAKYVGCSTTSINRWVRDGWLKPKGRAAKGGHLFDEATLEGLMERHAIGEQDGAGVKGTYRGRRLRVPMGKAPKADAPKAEAPKEAPHVWVTPDPDAIARRLRARARAHELGRGNGADKAAPIAESQRGRREGPPAGAKYQIHRHQTTDGKNAFVWLTQHPGGEEPGPVELRDAYGPGIYIVRTEGAKDKRWNIGEPPAGAPRPRPSAPPPPMPENDPEADAMRARLLGEATPQEAHPGDGEALGLGSLLSVGVLRWAVSDPSMMPSRLAVLAAELRRAADLLSLVQTSGIIFNPDRHGALIAGAVVDLVMALTSDPGFKGYGPSPEDPPPH